MLLIRVVSFKGQPVAGSPVAEFGEAGGTIGRGKNSTLVLPDPEMFISRTQAIISFQAGGYIITDNGTKNAVVLNGQPLGTGTQSRLTDGSQIQVGGYLLQASLMEAPAPPAPRVVPAPGPSAWPEPPPGQPKDDPLALLKPSAAAGPDPFADLVPPKPLPPPPLSDKPARDLLGGLHGREPGIDDLLKAPGLAPASGQPPQNAWPLGQREVGSGPVDPIDVMLGIVRPPSRPTIPDVGPEVATPFSPPAARPDPAFEPILGAPAAAAPAAPPAAAPPVAPVQAAPVAPAPPVPPAIPNPFAPPAPAQAPAAQPGPTFGEVPPAPSEQAATESALLQALLRGAGLPESAPLKNLTPETMETLGQLLREAVQGTLDLLRARGLMKSEMRADVTMIMGVENNPLKFSPSVEAALAHLVVPGVPGFMPPIRAMKDAYEDLRAHQLGFLAGMRAALDDVLARFTPTELQKRLSDPSVLDTLLPMNRKGKLWDLFVERYEDVAGEARDNFNAAFGKAFLKAYEAQVRELRAGPGRR